MSTRALLLVPKKPPIILKVEIKIDWQSYTIQSHCQTGVIITPRLQGPTLDTIINTNAALKKR